MSSTWPNGIFEGGMILCLTIAFAVWTTHALVGNFEISPWAFFSLGMGFGSAMIARLNNRR